MPGERFESATYSPATQDAFLREAAGLPGSIARQPDPLDFGQHHPDLLAAQHTAEPGVPPT